MQITIGIIAFFFGTIIGSFLNVVIFRYNSGKTLGGRSMCFSCSKTLGPLELVPVASFLSQRGKCLGCHSKISAQYPLVEAAAGIVSVLLVFKFLYLIPGASLLFVILFTYYFFLLSLLLVISVYDIRHKIIPDVLCLAFAVFALLGLFFIKGDALVVHMPSLSALLAGPALAAPFVLLWVFSRGRLIGLGDGKLALGLGFLLGISAGFAALMLSFWIGAVVGIALLLVHHAKKGMKSEIPFGPFLALGTAIAFFASVNISTILSWFQFLN